jgi:RND family efflux transporter MFP subunit
MVTQRTRQQRAAGSGWKDLIRWILAVAVLGTATAAAAETRVRTDPVRVEPLRQTVPVMGRLVACRSGNVAALVGGPVAEIRVEVGDRVRAGERIALVNRDRVAGEHDLRAARVTEAEAAVTAAEAEVALRRQELARLGGLKGSPAFSEGRFDDKQKEVLIAAGTLSRAQAALVSARAELQLAAIELADTEVRAPYGGVVSRRHTEIGAHVDRGDPVVSLVDDGCLEIEADVPAMRVAALTYGTPIGFALGGSAGEAVVRAVVPEEDGRTRTRIVRFVPDLAHVPGLAANQSVTLHVPAGEARDVVSVHKDAVINRDGRTAVFVIVDGRAELRPVELGGAFGGRFEVLNGIAAGAMAVIRGNERLQPGDRVRIDDGTRG